VKRTDRDEPTGVVTHICLGTAQESPSIAYLYLKLTKTPCFSYYLLCFFFFKIGEQEGRTGSARGWGEGLGKGVGG
jgi:hypothetical protein